MRQRQSQGQGRWVLGKADMDEVPVDEVRVLEFVRTGAARGMLGMFARAVFGR